MDKPHLDSQKQVLDKGFVRLVDYMGNDARIVQSARVSYGEGTKSYREDKSLINYLLRNRHTSPFEQVVFTFHVKMPIFVARQWIRHRTARLNEISGRYSVMKDEFYVPAPEQVCYQSTSNKQGRSGPLPQEGDFGSLKVIDGMVDDQKAAYGNYRNLVDTDDEGHGVGFGVARELARTNLPLSLYTEMYWQIDLHNLLHFLSLRLDSHAQYEIRVYAEALYEMIKLICPIACEAFEEHVLHAITLSKSDRELLAEFLNNHSMISTNCPDEVRHAMAAIEKRLRS